MVLNNKLPSQRPWPFWVAGTVSLLVVTLTGISLGMNAQTQTMDIEYASRLARAAEKDSPIALPINPSVLEQLNYYAGTEEGRAYMKRSIEQMKPYRAMVEGKIRAYGLPLQLQAIPITESGYQNLTPEKNPVGAAGLWQFMAATARNYNLTVKAGIDERLDVEKETDAAMRYLQALYLRFQDWHLAILAYNIGEHRTQEAINKIGSRDAWAIVEAGYSNDTDYLSKAIAQMILLRQPHILN